MPETVKGCKGCGRLLGASHTASCPELRESRAVSIVVDITVHERQCMGWSPEIKPEVRRGNKRTAADRAHLKPVVGATLKPPTKPAA